MSISDHYMVVCSRFLNYKPPTYQVVKGHSYRNYSYVAAKQSYKKCDLQRVFDSNDVDVVWSKLLEIITSCANRLCPERDMKIGDNKPCWITNEILELFSERDQAFTAFFKQLKIKSPPVGSLH